MKLVMEVNKRLYSLFLCYNICGGFMILEALEKCMLCPRNCMVNRYETTGFCGAKDKIRLSYYSIHMWEEPIISGDKGSGTIFYSNCNLRCMFCQNKKISIDNYGKDISDERFRR